jgi:glyoxylase-like metal-dependent hydrolase (beta-lactamase superfamily II)
MFKTGAYAPVLFYTENMTIHLLNCFTCNSRLGTMKTGLLCLLVETDQGLVLVDTGLGLDDYAHPTWFTQLFRVITQMPFDPQQAAVNQIRRLGFRPEDARHIILTHMHFDHCGGLPDFPGANVHVHRREYEAFVNGPRTPFELAYVRRHIEKVRDWAFYASGDEKWFGFDAIRLPFTPQMWLVPLFGHSRGHCGLAIQTPDGWHFHVGDAGVDVVRNRAPDWLIRAVLGPHWPRLRDFARAHPEIRLTASHMILSFFASQPQDQIGNRKVDNYT